MELGNNVKIKECHKIPELVGQEATVVGIVPADQEFSKYPIMVKISSGEHADKVCGFREDELEPVPGVPEVFLEK